MKVCNSPLLTDDPDENVSIVGTVNFSYMCSINSALHSLYSLYTVKNAGHGANSVKCLQFFEILLPLEREGNFQQKSYKNSSRTLILLPRYFGKVEF